MRLFAFTLGCLSLVQTFASLISVVERTEHGLELPIYKNNLELIQKRETRKAGLGDFFDVTYSVIITLGGLGLPFVLDTGSSDLWAVSASCQTPSCTSTDLQLYPPDTFRSAGLSALLLYGDSSTGTHASGLVGTDIANLAGIDLPDQLLAAINDTNTTVMDAGAVGIVGLGFPINSALWFEMFSHEHPVSSSQRRYVHKFPSLDFQPTFPSLGAFRGDYPGSNNSSKDARSLSSSEASSQPPSGPVNRHKSRQASSTSSWTPVILDSFSQIGPPLTRALSELGMNPRFTVTLQRDTVHIGGNAGMLTIGSLPEGVSEDKLTWVDVRRYPASDGGLSPPPDAPEEVYPIAWEIFLDEVYLDGQKLPRSAQVDQDIAPSALLDTGNSLIRGPPDTVAAIKSIIGSSSAPSDGQAQGWYPCSETHVLVFQFGGKNFTVDTRDFGNQAFQDTVEWCVPSIAATDPPVRGNGYLYSWNLGDPFLKSVLASFHYGNLSYPSEDPPRIGLLSTVPPDMDAKYRGDVEAASANGGNFPAIIEPAPTSLPPASTNSDGVPKAIPTAGSDDQRSNGARLQGLPGPIRRPLAIGTALITGGILLG